MVGADPTEAVLETLAVEFWKELPEPGTRLSVHPPQILEVPLPGTLFQGPTPVADLLQESNHPIRQGLLRGGQDTVGTVAAEGFDMEAERPGLNGPVTPPFLNCNLLVAHLHLGRAALSGNAALGTATRAFDVK